MTHEDDLPAEVRRQDEEDELQVAAQLAEVRRQDEEDELPAEVRRQDEEDDLPAEVRRQDEEDDLPAEVRRQDEEDELQVAAQLAELRQEENVPAARRRWSNLSKRTRVLLITVAVVDGALKVAALIDIQRRPASQIRGRKGMWAAAVALVNSAGVVPASYFVFGRHREP